MEFIKGEKQFKMTELSVLVSAVILGFAVTEICNVIKK